MTKLKVHRYCGKFDCECTLSSHPKSKYWNYTKNGDVKPGNIMRTSEESYWFMCDVCKHDFQKKPKDIVYGGGWCYYCSDKWKHCGIKSCEFCFNKSFASNPNSKYWVKELNKVTPFEMTKASGQKFWFNCDVCNHNIYMSLHDVHSGYWCGYCSEKWKHCGDIKCKFCYNRSFASHHKSKYWHPVKNKIKPLYVAKSSKFKAWMRCEECDKDFEISLNHVTTHGAWCSCVFNKTEAKLFEWFIECYPTFNVETQKKFDWCRSKKKNRKHFPYDFYIQDLELIIELDGSQHFEQVRDWTTPEDQQDRDIFKMKKAIENDLLIIRIYQDDVWRDRNNWDTKLVDAIEKCVEKRVICIKTNKKFVNEVYEKYEQLND